MWGVFIGLGLGVFEIFILKKLIGMMTVNRTAAAIAVPVTIAKLAMILVVLWIMAKFVSIEAMLWCAAGITIALVGIPVALGISIIRGHKKSKQHGGEHK
jgi:hypothetical protein